MERIIISFMLFSFILITSSKNLPLSLVKSLKSLSIDEALATSIFQSADSCVGTYTTQTTPFLSPADCSAVSQVFEELIEVKVAFAGGYPQADRKIAIFERNEEYGEDPPVDTAF